MQITLLHVHGSVVLYEVEPDVPTARPSLMFVQPSAYNAASGMLELLKLKEPPDRQHHASDEERRVVGYSFPTADADHIKRLFVPGVIRHDATLISVNPANPDEGYRRRVDDAFPTISKKEYTPDGFATFATSLNWRMTH